MYNEVKGWFGLAHLSYIDIRGTGRWVSISVTAGKFLAQSCVFLVLHSVAKSLVASWLQSMTIASVLASTVPIPVSWPLIWLGLGSMSGKRSFLTQYVLDSCLVTCV